MKYNLKLRIFLAVIATVILFSGAAYMNADRITAWFNGQAEEAAEEEVPSEEEVASETETEKESSEESESEEETEETTSTRSRAARETTASDEEEEEETETTAAVTYDLTAVSVTLYETDLISAVITGVGFSEEAGLVTVHLTVETTNKTADQDMKLRLTNEYVNGVRSSRSDSVTLMAGESGETTFEFLLEMPEDIGDITDLEFYAELWEVETYEGSSWTSTIGSLGTTTVHVYPQGEENASTFERATKETDVVLLADVVTLTYIGYGTEGTYPDLYDVIVPLYMENLSGYDLIVEAEIISVNGIEIQDYLIWEYFDLAAGTSSYIEFNMDFDYDLSETGITDSAEITSLEIELKTKYDDYKTLTSGVYTLNFQ